MATEKILIYKPLSFSCESNELIDDIIRIFPNSIIVDSEEKLDFQRCIIIRIHENNGIPAYIIINTNETQIVFKIISYRTRKNLGIKTEFSDSSQLILSNFTSDLGLKIAEIFMNIFPMDTTSNQIVNFSVYKEFVFFRMYKFQFSLSTKKVKDTKTKFQQIGPQLTLRLYRFVENIHGRKLIHDFNKYVKNRHLL